MIQLSQQDYLIILAILQFTKQKLKIKKLQNENIENKKNEKNENVIF